MNKEKFSKLQKRHTLVRGTIVAFVLVTIAIFEGLELNWQVRGTNNLWNTLDVILLALIGLLVYLSVSRYLRLLEERESLQTLLESSQRQLTEARQRQNTVMRISQMFMDTSDEEEVVGLTLRLSRELLGARGVAFVPLDENAHPLGARSQGDIPFSEANAWLEYLASPNVRQACAECLDRERLTHTCPLLKGAFEDTTGVYCIPLRRDNQDFGILNIFMAEDVVLDAGAQALIRTLADETTVALESARMRQRAMTSLQQIQSLQQRADLTSLLKDLMASLKETLEADYLLVVLNESYEPEDGEVSIGMSLPENARHLVDGILHSVMTSQEPVLVENTAGGLASSGGVRAFLAAPLLVRDSELGHVSMGAILAASLEVHAFSQRQLSILEMIAGQVSLIVHNVRLMAQLEYKTVIDERMRLAREIHDGLAQTLGFLKLKTAQMRGFLDQGETELLREAVDLSYAVVEEAYQDARQAIDGLRLSSKESFGEWLQQTVEEFQDYTGVVVKVCDAEIAAGLAPEISAQLIRIIQEALSNVRKHARASSVEISCRRTSMDMLIDVVDDGKGFNVEDVPGPSKHGLRGMRERAELIGADLQVISQLDRGTSVRLRLPLPEKEVHP